MSSYVKGATVELPLETRVTATDALADPATLTLTIVAPDGTSTVYAYPSANVVRDSLGTFRGSFVTNDDGEWGWLWTATGAVAGVEQGTVFVVPDVATAQPALTTTYATVQELRDQLGVNDDQLTDREAKQLILTAEDLVDGLLGAWTPDEDSGRSIVEADVDSWQWAKLKRAVVLLAAAMQQDPTLLEGQQWDRVKGPDFEFQGPRRGSSTVPIPAGVIALLNTSGLRVLATRVGGRRSPRLAASFFDTRNPISPRRRTY